MLEQPLFVFEMANNHQGRLDHGLKIVAAMAEIARKHGVRAAVKLQYRDLDTFIHPEYREREGVKHVRRFLETRLAPDQFKVLVEATRSSGLLTMVTPFDEASVCQCQEHNVDILKVASCSATDWPLLEAISRARKPVVVSTGGVTLPNIDSVVSFFQHRSVELAVLHCVGLYPVPPAQLSLSFIDRLARRYTGVPVGYSGHEEPGNLTASAIAVAQGAVILERHVGIATDTVALNAYSSSPEQTDRWVGAVCEARAMCGQEEKSITPAETESLRSLMRGTYVARPLAKGERIRREDVFFAMPCADGQTTAGEFGAYRAAFTATRDYRQREPLHEQAATDLSLVVRHAIHQARGMLAEARIVLEENPSIELSHHYGLERFQAVGALIVNVVNREYCKKLVIVLPGQRHPNHRHERKEETFQLLSGDLDLQINDVSVPMSLGKKVLIERGSWHAFSSLGGAIFEEVSTTHYRGDSYYQDPAIAQMDPMKRKTVLEGW
jgi:N-acetylneuraminate synthase